MSSILKASSIVLPMDMDRNPLVCDKVLKLRPKIQIDCEKRTFKLTVNIPGFKSDDINVFAGNGKVAVKAADKTNLKNLNICKVYKAVYTLPPGVVMEKLRKSYHDDVLCIRGEIGKVGSCNEQF